MLSELGRRPMVSEGPSFGDDLEKEIGLMIRSRQEEVEADDELSLYRSGSAPPTVEGSLNAVGGLLHGGGGGGAFSEFVTGKNGFVNEEELRSDPAYSAYYYSNANTNPRLPPPLMSKEDWRFSQRLKGGGSSVIGGDRRSVSSRSMQMPPGFDSRKPENDRAKVVSNSVSNSNEWGGDGLIRLPALGGLGIQQKSLAEIFQSLGFQ